MEKTTHPRHHYNNCEDLSPLLEEMRKARLRVTEPRKAILHYLIEYHGPYSAEEIYKAWSKPVCDVVTIYRCMTSLEKAGLIKRCDFGDGTARYELAAQNSHHHHHVICRECKKVTVLEDCELGNLNSVPRKHGYTNVSHSLEFFGVCPNCK